MALSGISADFASTSISSTPQHATPARNISAGVTSSPGQPFCSGPSTMKWWFRAPHITRPKTSVEAALTSYCRTSASAMVSSLRTDSTVCGSLAKVACAPASLWLWALLQDRFRGLRRRCNRFNAGLYVVVGIRFIARQRHTFALQVISIRFGHVAGIDQWLLSLGLGPRGQLFDGLVTIRTPPH